jgi:hypothetical protein
MEAERLRRTFADLGVSEAPESGDGLDLVRAAHVPTPDLRGTTVLDHAVPWALDSREFRRGFLRRFFSADVPFLGTVPLCLFSTVYAWNSEEAASRLKAAILDASDSSEARSFWVAITSQRIEREAEPSAHMVAVEFELRPSSRRGSSAWLYNSTLCEANRSDRFAHTDLVRWGVLLPTLSDPEVRAALRWPPLDPAGWKPFDATDRGEFGSRDEALVAAKLLRRDTMGWTGWPFDATARSEAALRSATARRETALLLLEWMGLNGFAPAAPCQVGPEDFLCQTWVFWLYRFRVRHRRPEDALKALDATSLLERRGDLLALVRDEFGRGGSAADFLGERRIERAGGGFSEGRSFAAWLRWAVERPDFGAEYLARARGVL